MAESMILQKAAPIKLGGFLYLAQRGLNRLQFLGLSSKLYGLQG